MIQYHKQAKKFLKLAELYFECGDYVLGNLAHDVARACLIKHETIQIMKKNNLLKKF